MFTTNTIHRKNTPTNMRKENPGQSKMQEWKMWDKKSCGTKTQGWKSCSTTPRFPISDFAFLAFL